MFHPLRPHLRAVFSTLEKQFLNSPQELKASNCLPYESPCLSWFVLLMLIEGWTLSKVIKEKTPCSLSKSVLEGKLEWRLTLYARADVSSNALFTQHCTVTVWICGIIIVLKEAFQPNTFMLARSRALPSIPSHCRLFFLIGPLNPLFVSFATYHHKAQYIGQINLQVGLWDAGRHKSTQRKAMCALGDSTQPAPEVRIKLKSQEQWGTSCNSYSEHWKEVVINRPL